MTQTGQHLRELGLSPSAAALYEHLISVDDTSLTEAGASLALTDGESASALAELESLALAVHDGERVRPLDPESGLRALSDQVRSQLDIGIQRAVAEYDAHRRHRGTGGAGSVVEVLEGTDIQRAVAEVERSAHSQIRAFDTPPYGISRPINPVEMENLRRGVDYRIIYARAAVEDSSRFRSSIRPCIEAGEVARIMPRVPAKMLLADDRLALIALTSPNADRRPTVLLIHQSDVLPALVELFELCWPRATPLSGREETGDELRPIERLLLRHLAAGLTDESAARNLGISKRTVARYVEHLMTLADVSSRFQLAIHAQTHDWIA